MKKYEDKYVRQIKKYDTKMEELLNSDSEKEEVHKQIDDTQLKRLINMWILNQQKKLEVLIFWY